jgi:hypothetical protein
VAEQAGVREIELSGYRDSERGYLTS